MYYAEKWIDGLLYFRLTPKGEWKPFSSNKYATKVKRLQNEVESLHKIIDQLEYKLGTEVNR